MRTIVDLQDYSKINYTSIGLEEYSYLDASDNMVINFTNKANQGNKNTKVYEYYDRIH